MKYKIVDNSKISEFIKLNMTLTLMILMNTISGWHFYYINKNNSIKQYWQANKYL